MVLERHEGGYCLTYIFKAAFGCYVTMSIIGQGRIQTMVESRRADAVARSEKWLDLDVS